jgi:phosphate acyltransferase
MKIIVDCFGGDNCPEAPVKGAVLAINENKDLTVSLAGKKDEIEKVLSTLSYNKSQVEILDATDVITNDDHPVMAIRRKKESSMVVGLKALCEDKYDGMVSSGNTGALLCGGTLLVKLVDGVTRAMLAPIVPTLINGKYTIVCDAGANVDCKPNMLKEFAIMGNVYVKSLFNIDSPKIGLLNNGAEEEKGCALTKEVHQLLKNEKELNFVGNVEPTDFVSGKVDVIVCDGFAGNIAIKSTEGACKNLFGMIKEAILNGGLRAKIGYLLLKPALKSVKNKMSTDEVGGAVLLGCKKVIVKAHGSSKEVPFKAAIMQAATLAQKNVCELIEKGLKVND